MGIITTDELPSWRERFHCAHRQSTPKHLVRIRVFRWKINDLLWNVERTDTTGYLKKFQSLNHSVYLYFSPVLRTKLQAQRAIKCHIFFSLLHCNSNIRRFGSCFVCTSSNVNFSGAHTKRIPSRWSHPDHTPTKLTNKTSSWQKKDTDFTVADETQQGRDKNGYRELDAEHAKVNFNWFSRRLDDSEFLICRLQSATQTVRTADLTSGWQTSSEWRTGE